MGHIKRFAIKEMKHFYRDKRSFIFILIFPLVLMGVLGTALSGTFQSERPPVDMEVLYKMEAGAVLEEAFADFVTDVDDEGIHFQQVETVKNGEKQVDEGKSDGFVSLHANGLDLYLTDPHSLESNILTSALESFRDSYNLVSEIIQSTPEKADIATSDIKHDFIQEHGVDSDKAVESMDYYAIVMTTMFIFIGAMFSSGLIAEERVLNTDTRLMIAPVRKGRILIGKMSGFVMIFSFFILVLFLFSFLIYHAEWGNHLLLVALLLLSEVIFTVCFGMGIGHMTQSSNKANVIIMIFIQVSAFFGGAFFNISNPDGVLNFIIKLSPLEWQNNALLNLIHANDLSYILPTVLLNVGIGALFLFIPMVLLRNREGML